MIPARSTQERKRIFAEVWRFLEGPRARQTDGYNSIMALMRAAGVDHACGKNDENDEQGDDDQEGDEGEEEGHDDDVSCGADANDYAAVYAADLRCYGA